MSIVTESPNSMKCLICLFGEEVRLYFVVIRPVRSRASRLKKPGERRIAR